MEVDDEEAYGAPTQCFTGRARIIDGSVELECQVGTHTGEDEWDGDARSYYPKYDYHLEWRPAEMVGEAHNTDEDRRC